MQAYDAIVVLGSRPDPGTWRFPDHIYRSLERAKQLLDDGVAPYVIASGKHAIRNEYTGVAQPVAECDMAKAYLVSIGCDPNLVLTEGESKDTLANFYFLKNNFFIPRHMHHILLVTTKARQERLRFIAQKVLEPQFQIAFDIIPYESPQSEYASEAFALSVQQKYLRDIPDGDDQQIARQFYHSPLYQFWKAYDLEQLKATAQAAR